jgi:hypothetical protein
MGCSNATPFPVSPLQVLLGGWPGKESAAAGLARAYTIKGDTFAYPQLGLQISRPNQKDWEFLPTASGMAVLLREGLVDAQPRPSLQVSVFPEPEGATVADALRGDLIGQFVTAEGKVIEDGGIVTSEIGVDGIRGQQWIINQAQPEGNGVTRIMRIYLVHEKQITLVQAQAEAGTFRTQLPAFEAMLKTLRVPKSPNADAAATAANVQKSIDLVRFDELAVPRLAVVDGAAALAIGVSLKPVDPRVWLTSSQGIVTTFERRNPPAGATLLPYLQLTVAPGVADPQAFVQSQDAEREALSKGASPVTVSAGTLAGRPAEVWDFSQKPPSGQGGSRTTRLRWVEGNTVALAQYTADISLFDGLKPDFEALLAAVNIPPDPQASAKPALPVVLPSAGPSAAPSATPSAAAPAGPSAAPSAGASAL